MRIPIMTQAEMNSFLAEMRAGRVYEPKVDFTGAEIATLDKQIDDFLVGLLASIQTAGGSLAEPGKDKVYRDFEEIALEVSLQFFDGLPDECKFEPGFWTYLSWRCADVISWRHPASDKEGWVKNFFARYSASDFIDAFLPRLVVQGLITRDDSARSFIRQDFWRSHVLRVKTGFSKEVSNGFANISHNHSINTEEARIMAKKVRAIRSNVIFEALDKAQAETLVGELRK